MRHRNGLSAMAAVAVLGASLLQPGLAARAAAEPAPVPTVTSGAVAGSLTAAPGWALRAGGMLVAALPVPGSAGAWAAWVPAGKWFLRGVMTGTGSGGVEVDVAGAHSAPLHLDGIQQAFGVSFTQPVAGPVQAALRITASWRPGDQITVHSLSAAPSTPSVTTVKAGTREVYLNGSAYTMKGYNYWSTMPIGDQFLVNSWAEDTGACQNDARLLAAAGVNTLRLYYEPDSVALLSNYDTCLDAFWANGIGAYWMVYPDFVAGGFNDPSLVPAGEEWVQRAINDVASHPATILWNVGNEEESTSSSAPLQWYGSKSANQPGLLDTYAAYIHQNDPDHLVSTTMTEAFSYQLSSVDDPHVDLWGVNSYSATQSPGTYFTTLKNEDPRPIYFSEWGTDRYYCITGTVFIPGSPESIVGGCKTPGSGEDQPAQASVDAAAWDNIAANLATDANTQGADIGGTAFMYSDNWSYSIGALEPTSPWTHDTIGRTWPAAPDGYENAEWWGVSDSLPRNSTQLRGTSTAFDALASRWRATTVPTDSNLAVAPVALGNGLCTVTVSWTSALAASTEVLGGIDLAAGNDGGDMYQDDTIVTDQYSDAANPAYVTSHSVTLPLQLVSGESYYIQPRGFTSSGLVGTGAPWVGHVYC